MVNRLVSATMGALLLVAGGLPQSVNAAEKGVLGVSVGALSVRPNIDSPVVGADAANHTLPVLNLHFYLPWFNEQLSLNTALGVTRHRFSAGGTTLGSASMVPLNLTLQYRFTAPGNGFNPYVGIGANNTIFSRQRGPVFEGLRTFKDSIGPVLQVGFDYWLDKTYFVNFDVRKFYIDTDVVPVGGSRIEKIDLDPVSIGLAIGARF